MGARMSEFGGLDDRKTMKWVITTPPMRSYTIANLVKY